MPAWWDVLGVAEDAEALAIRTAYRTLAREMHPDAASGSVADFQRLQAAYAAADAPPTEPIVDRLRSVIAEAIAAVFDEAGCFVAHEEAARPRVFAAEAGRKGRRLQEANGAPFDYYSPSALSLYRALRGGAQGGDEDRAPCPFASAAALARAIAAALPLRAYRDVQHCTSMPPGFVNLTLAHRSLTVAGRKVQCPICGDMCGIGRGIRQHLQSARHALSGEPLQAAVVHAAAAAKALPSPYAGETGADAAPDRSRSPSRGGATVDDGGCGLHLGLIAARDGDLDALCAAVRSADPVWDPSTHVDRNGSCALHYAAGAGHVHLCAYLLDECAVDVNQRVTRGRRDGRTALHWACRNGHCDAAKWLVERGAELVGTKDGTTPFHWAVWQGHRAVCKWIVESFGSERARATNAFGCNAFHWAALQNDVPMARFLLYECGVDPMKRNNQGHSSIHKAAWRGAAEIARWLYEENSVPITAFAEPDVRGYRPSDIARLAGHSELATWFLARERESGEGGETEETTSDSFVC